MNNALRGQIKAYLIDYLKIRKPDIKITGNKLFVCPFCEEHEIKSDKPSCNIYPPGSYSLFCFSPEHQKIGDIFALVRRMEDDKANWADEAIADYLVDLFKIQTDDKVEKALINYQLNGFDLVPVEKNGKAAIEKEWTKKFHKNIVEWQDWLASSLNIGIKTGKPSNITVIDVDLHGAELPNDIKELIGETFTQKTKNGFHFVFGYEPDLPKTNFDLDEKVHIDVMNDGGQIVVYPSTVDGVGREWNDSPIAKMPQDFKEWLLKFIKPVKQEENETPDFADIRIPGLAGCCNNTFIKMAGLLRKKLNPSQTADVLYLFNSLLEQPMENKAIRSMLNSVEKYNLTDKDELKNKVLEHLALVMEGSSRDLKDSLGFGKAEIEQVLAQLLKEELIYKTGRLYRFMNKIAWKEEFVSDSKIVDYKMPYFDHIATFRNSDMLIIGGSTSVGKSHIALNIIRKLIEQGKKPFYLSSEPGNRFSTISIALGIKEGEFSWFNHYQPETIELPDNGLTVLDWLSIDDFSQTAVIYKRFAAQLDKHGGNLIVFAQLKEDGEWFAPNLIKFYASLACKVRHPNKADRTNGVFETEKVRESKSKQQYITIPFTYDFESKRVELKQ